MRENERKGAKIAKYKNYPKAQKNGSNHMEFFLQKNQNAKRGKYKNRRRGKVPPGSLSESIVGDTFGAHSPDLIVSLLPGSCSSSPFPLESHACCIFLSWFFGPSFSGRSVPIGSHATRSRLSHSPLQTPSAPRWGRTPPSLTCSPSGWRTG